MTMWIFLIGIIVGIILGIMLVYRAAVTPLHKKIEKLSEEKQLLSTKHSEIPKDFKSFMEKYPYVKENFRFIGNPVDGIQFENDQIIFVEFTTNKSKLTAKQNKVKKLVNERKVKWFEFKTK